MLYDNEMKLSFASRSENEALARVCVASFVAQLDPDLNDISEVKTAVSEAVTNSIIHGYEGKEGIVSLSCALRERELFIEISDNGIGIEDVEKAREPLFTTKSELERSGMGFTIMEAFMDEISVSSNAENGTVVKMRKVFN